MKNTTSVINTELFTIPIENNKYIIYAPLRRAAFIGNTGMVNYIAGLIDERNRNNSDLNNSLLEFLRRLEIVDGNPENVPISNFNGIPKPTTVTLFLTTACNLRCTYCYAAAGDTPLKSMSFEIAKKGIDFIFKNAVETNTGLITVNYHGGGEPTANWKILVDSYEYARAKAIKHGLGIIGSTATNGILTDNQINWIIENLEGGASLSFDGLPSMHDMHRKTISGKGSSEKVIHTIKMFDKANYDYGIRVTVTADQIQQLPLSIEYICSNFKTKNVQVEPSYQMGRWKEAPTAETTDFILNYRKSLEIAEKHGIALYFSAARIDVLTNHFCGITQDTFALSPDGNVSACYEVFSEDNEFSDVFFYGAPEQNKEGYKFNLKVLNNLRDQVVNNHKYCEGCYAKWHCAGDCYNKSLTVNGRDNFQGSDRCHITRELTKDLILKKIKDSGGLFWHESI
jgi:uncharacterized protein